jgi:hypothetical protein
MIHKTDYMKNVLSMSYEEKLLLLDRADAWMEAYPSLRAAVTSWEDAPVKDFDEGLLLCSCLRRAQSFVDSAYKFNAQKCLDMIKNTIDEVVRIARPAGPRTESEKKTKKIKAFVPKADLPNEDGTVAKRTEKQRLAMEQEAMDEEQRNDKYRPQNLNDYIHLLPSSLQYEAREVKKKYYAPLREARARMESLAENPDATEQQRSEAAARLAAADDALADFWERVDLAYKKVMGVELPEDSSKEKKLSEFTKADIEAIEDESMREKMKVARIDNDKKYLRRSDLPEDEDTKEQLLLRATELKEWGVKITARQLANMQRFGVEFSME